MKIHTNMGITLEAQGLLMGACQSYRFFICLFPASDRPLFLPPDPWFDTPRKRTEVGKLKIPMEPSSFGGVSLTMKLMDTYVFIAGLGP